MAKAALWKKDFTLVDAMVSVEPVGLDASLIELVPRINDVGFVLVRGEDSSLCGIVTSADLGVSFADLAKPFFLLGEVEKRLRYVLNRELLLNWRLREIPRLTVRSRAQRISRLVRFTASLRTRRIGCSHWWLIAAFFATNWATSRTFGTTSCTSVQTLSMRARYALW